MEVPSCSGFWVLLTLLHLFSEPFFLSAHYSVDSPVLFSSLESAVSAVTAGVLVEESSTQQIGSGWQVCSFLSKSLIVTLQWSGLGNGQTYVYILYTWVHFVSVSVSPLVGTGPTVPIQYHIVLQFSPVLVLYFFLWQ